jgi:uncharacterized protein YutE (UPF0331/DUF86 family)
MVLDDIVVNKSLAIETCLSRIREEHAGDDGRLNTITRYESILLNLQRACELSIDLAMHLVRLKKLGAPQTTREAFELLEQAQLLSPGLSERLRKMVGFRNTAIHQYQKLDQAVVRSIVNSHLSDFEDLVRAVKLA